MPLHRRRPPAAPDRRRRRAVAAALLAGGLVVAAACAAGETASPTSSTPATRPTSDPTPSTAPPTTAPAPTTPPTPTAADDEAAVLAAYQGFWDTWLAANDPPNPDHPGLARYYTGPALTKARSEIEKNRQSGVAIRMPGNERIGLDDANVTLSGNTAIVTTCIVDRAVTVSSTTGAVIDSSIASSRLKATLQRLSAGWVVTTNEFVSTVPGPQCPT